MEPHATRNFASLAETIRANWLGLRTGETTAAEFPVSPRIPERLVQAIWYEKLLQPTGLKTIAGSSLEIVDAGRWNAAEGPDFLGAELLINGKRIKGDVEVHVLSGDWTRHRHISDFNYNNVILHAFLTRDDDKSYEQLHNGQQIERFEMEPVLFPDLQSIRQTFSTEDYPYNSEAGLGRCYDHLLQEDEQILRQFLAAGGRERMEAKIRRIERQAISENLGQLLYQAVMTSMGFKGNKTLFFLLSKRVPLADLLMHSKSAKAEEKVERMQALLLHVSGLTPRAEDHAKEIPSSTMDYLNRINGHWSDLSGYFSDRMIPPTKRWHGGTRPVNFPERRLAGIARFVAQFPDHGDLFDHFEKAFTLILPEKTSPKEIRAFLKAAEQLLGVHAPHDFWSRHFSFTSQPTANPMSLIGGERARSVVLNAAFPLLFHYARQKSNHALEERLWKIYSAFPMLESNNVERFMRYRLFGASPRAKSLIDSEIMQQGLFHVFHICCNNNERTCSQCIFLREHGL